MNYDCPDSEHEPYKIKSMIEKTIFKTKDYGKIKFLLDIENADTVEIRGLNEDWNNPVELKRRKKDGLFWAEVQLPKDSRHEFRYRINDEYWLNDPQADGEQPNVFGETNSILVVN